jgi:hypothetical protein
MSNTEKKITVEKTEKLSKMLATLGIEEEKFLKYWDKTTEDLADALQSYISEYFKDYIRCRDCGSLISKEYYKVEGAKCTCITSDGKVIDTIPIRCPVCDGYFHVENKYELEYGSEEDDNDNGFDMKLFGGHGNIACNHFGFGGPKSPGFCNHDTTDIADFN